VNAASLTGDHLPRMRSIAVYQDEQIQAARAMFKQGRSDEEVERLTGLDAVQILEIRAAAASEPSGLIWDSISYLPLAKRN
jgi:hypothetical protein